MVEATVTLYKDIGLYPDYKRSMLFESKTAQNNWFSNIASNLKKTLTANYNKIQNTFVLHEDVGNVYEYTYVRLQDIDTSGRIYYGFVTNVSLVDEENTEFTIALDPIQTFMCEWSLGECLVMREHCDRWNKSSSNPIRVTPNLDNVVAFMETNVATEAINSEKYVLNIIAVATTQEYWDTAKQKKIESKYANRIIFLVIPIQIGYNIQEMYAKVDVSLQDGASGTRTTLALPLPTAQDAVSGNVPAKLGLNPESVIGSWLVPCHGVQIYESTAQDYDGNTKNTVNVLESMAMYYSHGGTIEGPPWRQNTYFRAEGIISKIEYGAFCFNYVDLQDLFTDEITYQLNYEKPVKPTTNTNQYSDTYEPALYMEPYRKRGIISNCTALVEIPDNIFHNGNIYLHANLVCSSTGINNELFVDNQNSIGPVGRQETAMMGAYGRDINLACDITTNEWLSYCLTSRKSDRDSVKSQIISNSITNLVGMGYGGALVGSRANSGQEDPMKGGKMDSGPIRAKGGFGGAMLRASAFGMATGLVTSAVQGWDMWNQQMAKESSIKNQPSQLSVTGEAFQYALEGNYDYRKYECKVDEYNYETAKNNFRYYGYMVNRVEIPNIKSRYYYNYICTLNTTIKGSLSSEIKSAIATIFEKGITFFHADHCNSTEYNNYENIERALI